MRKKRASQGEETASVKALRQERVACILKLKEKKKSVWWKYGEGQRAGDIVLRGQAGRSAGPQGPYVLLTSVQPADSLTISPCSVPGNGSAGMAPTGPEPLALASAGSWEAA